MKRTQSKKATASAPAAKAPTAKPLAAPAPTAKTTVIKSPAAKAEVKPPAVKSPAPTAKSSVAKTPATPAPVQRREITSELIASRAYSLWEQRGRPQGQDLELWLQAEQQLKSSQSFAA